MKMRYYLMAVCALALCACEPLYFSRYSSRKTIDLQLPPASKKPEVYYPDELPPFRPYCVVADLKVSNMEELVSINLIRDLVTKGREYGADAILVDVPNPYSFQEAPHPLNFFADVNDLPLPEMPDGEQTALQTQARVTGFGIKYLDSLDFGFLAMIPKSLSFYKIDPTDSTQKELLLSGDIDGDYQLSSTSIFADEGKRLFEANSLRYDLDFMTKSQDLWIFADLNIGYKQIRRFMRLPDWYLYQVTIARKNETQNSRLRRIEITYYPKGNAFVGQRYVLKPQYDLQGTLLQKDISENNRLRRKEKITYDDLGRMAKRTCYDLSKEGILTPVYETTYTYYTVADAPKIFSDSIKIYNRKLLPQDWPKSQQ